MKRHHVRASSLLLNHHAMTLVEVLVAIGVMSIMMIAMMNMQENQSKANNFLEFQMNRNQLQNTLVQQFFNDPNNCACLFKDAADFPITPPQPGLTFTSKETQMGRYNFITPGDCSSATIPQPLVSSAGVNNLKMTSVQLTKLVNVSGYYSGEVVIGLQSTKAVAGPKDLQVRIPVNVSAVANGGNMKFLGCSTTTGADFSGQVTQALGSCYSHLGTVTCTNFNFATSDYKYIEISSYCSSKCSSGEGNVIYEVFSGKNSTGTSLYKGTACHAEGMFLGQTNTNRSTYLLPKVSGGASIKMTVSDCNASSQATVQLLK